MTDPHAAEPLRYAEARAVALNPEDGGEGLVRALRTVVLFTLADAFALVPEEAMWAGYHLDRFFEPLASLDAHLVPLPVRHEMLDHHYTQALDAHEASGGAALVHYDPAAMHASDADWAAVIMQMITGCFTLRPMDEMTMRGQIAGMLRELGVGDPSNPRGARYLPNDVRHRLEG